MNRKRTLGWVGLIACAALLFGWSAAEADGWRGIRVRLDGFHEVAAVSTTGSGKLRLQLNEDSFNYELSYADLEGTVQQAHLHLGQKGVNGGIVVFLCTNLGNAPAGTTVPACPGPNSGTVSGTRTSADITAVAAQGIAAGEFEEVVRAIRAGVVYVNVHSTKHPPGEIRGQLPKSHHHDDDDDND